MRDDKTFEKQAELYCMMVENVHDKQFIMAQAKALDHAYERIGQIIKDQIADAERDLAVLTGATNATSRHDTTPGKTGKKTAPVRD